MLFRFTESFTLLIQLRSDQKHVSPHSQFLYITQLCSDSVLSRFKTHKYNASRCYVIHTMPNRFPTLTVYLQCSWQNKRPNFTPIKITCKTLTGCHHHGQCLRTIQKNAIRSYPSSSSSSSFLAQQPNAGQGRLTRELSRSHSATHTTVGRTPLDEWSARRRDLYLTTHNTYKTLTSMPPGRIRSRDPIKWSAADPRLRQLGHWDRLVIRHLLNFSPFRRPVRLEKILNKYTQVFWDETLCY
jgi:hypothetical protein